jgi:hypothetical protein
MPPSVHPAGQGVDLGHIGVTELLQSLSDLMLFGLDIQYEQCIVFCLHIGRLHGQGELEDGIVVKLIFPQLSFQGYFGCLQSCSVLV